LTLMASSSVCRWGLAYALLGTWGTAEFSYVAMTQFWL